MKNSKTLNDTKHLKIVPFFKFLCSVTRFFTRSRERTAQCGGQRLVRVSCYTGHTPPSPQHSAAQCEKARVTHAAARLTCSLAQGMFYLPAARAFGPAPCALAPLTRARGRRDSPAGASRASDRRNWGVEQVRGSGPCRSDGDGERHHEGMTNGPC